MKERRQKKKKNRGSFERNLRKWSPFSIAFIVFIIIGMYVLIWFSMYDDANGNVTLPHWFVAILGDLPWGMAIMCIGLVIYVFRDRSKQIITHAWHTSLGPNPILFVTNEETIDTTDETTGATKKTVIEESYTGIKVGGTTDDDTFYVGKSRRLLVTPTAYINDYHAGGMSVDIHPDPTPFDELPAIVRSAILQCGDKIRFDPESDTVEFSRDYCPPENKGAVRSYHRYDQALRMLGAMNKSLRGKLADSELTIRGLMRQRRMNAEHPIGGSVGPNEDDRVSKDVNDRTEYSG